MRKGSRRKIWWWLQREAEEPARDGAHGPEGEDQREVAASR